MSSEVAAGSLALYQVLTSNKNMYFVTDKKFHVFSVLVILYVNLCRCETACCHHMKLA